MATFVLVPGACHGAWWYEPLSERLRALGHRAFPVSLTGVGERRHLANATVNLDTHIQDVLGVLENAQLDDAVLVGHSYGGMVIAGAADRVPERVSALVFLEAFVPRDGDSCWTLTTAEQREWYLDVGADGFSVPSLPFFDPRATPHPLAGFLQRIRLDGNLDRFTRTFVYATEWDGESPFTKFYNRFSDDPQWTVHALKTRHNVLRDTSDEILQIMLDTADAIG